MLNNPLIYVDPSGHVVETVIDVAALAKSGTDFYTDPSFFNGIMVLGDTIAVLLPIVPSFSVSVKVGGKFGKNLGKIVDGIKNVFWSGDKADGVIGASKKGTETVQRWMSKTELISTKQTGLLRGGRGGTHYVTNSANINANRARQRLSLDRTPEVRVTREIPAGKLSSPTKVSPQYNMLGGGMERTATGDIPVIIIKEY